MMLAQRTDLSFDRDASVRLIPFIVALMVYLAILALAGSLVLQRGRQQREGREEEEGGAERSSEVHAENHEG